MPLALRLSEGLGRTALWLRLKEEHEVSNRLDLAKKWIRLRFVEASTCALLDLHGYIQVQIIVIEAEVFLQSVLRADGECRMDMC